MPEHLPTGSLAASLAGLSGEVRDEIDRLARLGYRGVVLDATRPDLRPRTLDGAARRAAIATFRRSEVRLMGIDLWIPPGDLVDEIRCTRAFEAIGAALELAADFGRVPVNLVLPEATRSGTRPTLDPPAGTAAAVAAAPESLRRFIESPPLASTPDADVRDANDRIDGGSDATFGALLGELLHRAERFGVDLVDHSLAAPDGPGARGTGSQRLRIGIDPATCLSRGIDPVDAVIGAASALGGARLCDLTRSGMRAPIADSLCGSDARDARLDPAA